MQQCHLVSKTDSSEKKQKPKVTTNSGMPIFSVYTIYKHYLSVEQWKRACQLPMVFSFFERCMNARVLVE